MCSDYALKMAAPSTQRVLQSLGGMEFDLMGDQPRASILRLAIQELGLFKIFSGEANGNPLQYSCLKNSMD